MNVVTPISSLREERSHLPGPVGFVPTMGFLHEGHLDLVRRARAECAGTVASIFVNPTQFGPGEDLASYPRDLARDLALLKAEGVDLVWTPAEADIYPPGFQTWVEVAEVSRPLEGARRPGHFRGVATVVAKLFLAVQPDRAYFGQKDAQQVVVIRRMVHDLAFPLKIVVCPTRREADGLAMSSRNSYLTPAQRAAAPVLHRALRAAADAHAGGTRDAESLRAIVSAQVAVEPLADLQYVSCADPDTLAELAGPVERALLSLAATVGRTRLIDNVLLGADHATDD